MGTKHSCKYYRLMADEYVEGELTEAEAREFEAHIAECEECRREVEAIRSLNAILRSNREQVPEGLHARIMDAVKAEPKPKKKALLFRRSALSAACFFICLSLTIIIAMLPMWNPSNAGGMVLPEDPEYAAGETQVASTEAALKSESADSPADVTEIEQEMLESVPQSSAAAALPEASPSDTIEETMVVDETPTPPAEEMTAAESLAPPEVTVMPEIVHPETALPATEAPEIDAPAETQAALSESPSYDKAPSAESTNAPGGEEITMALLVVSGLLAVASFVAFLISLSSVRNTPQKKDKED